MMNSSRISLNKCAGAWYNSYIVIGFGVDLYESIMIPHVIDVTNQSFAFVEANTK